MECVKWTLDKFCAMSGQEISYEKSNILFSNNVTRRLRLKLCSSSGIKETHCLGKYLGVPLKGKSLRRSGFSYVTEQIAKRLTSWKARHLSFAGRVTLTKSVMEVFPIYRMMTNMLPKSSIKEIHKMQRSFIWGDTDLHRNYHVVNWKKVTTSKN